MKSYSLRGEPQDMPFTAVDALKLAAELKVNLETRGVKIHWHDAGPAVGESWRIGDIGVYSGYDVQRAQFLIKAIAYEKSDA